MKKSNAAKKTDLLENVFILNGHMGQAFEDLIVEIIKDEGKYCVVETADNRLDSKHEFLVERKKLVPVISRDTKETKVKESSSKDQMVTLRMSPEEVELVDKIAAEASEKVGIDVTRSWVFRELLKIGAETLQKRFRG
jgi:hypothetical protein